jgi:hypothetical protein
MNDDYDKYASRFSVSHMNNAKWRKLFLAWARSGIEISHAEWSYIDSENIDILPLPQEYDVLEERFADGRFQPFEYKWIRKIKIPHQYRPKLEIGYEKKQDTATLKRIASDLGQFPIFNMADGIEVRGYEE